ncbi:MAG: hypothetical protein WC759_02380 [Candidatus Micrarchaeia archaeon]|jgi:hypothetical protein
MDDKPKKREMSKEEIISKLETTGFPLEITVRKILASNGIETTSMQYVVEEGEEKKSKEIDAVGNVLYKNVRAAEKNQLNLRIKLVGEVKRWVADNICFYEVENEGRSLELSLPNFLNNLHSVREFFGGERALSKYYADVGYFPVSKSVSMVNAYEKNGTRRKNEEAEGNERLYKTAENLSFACEYFHKISRASISVHDIKTWKEIGKGIPVHACFPVIFTDARIFKVKAIEPIELEQLTNFVYLFAPPNPDKIPVTTKKRPYLPIIIANRKGIVDIVALIRKITNKFYGVVEESFKSEKTFYEEYEDYMRNEHNKRQTIEFADF